MPGSVGCPRKVNFKRKPTKQMSIYSQKTSKTTPVEITGKSREFELKLQREIPVETQFRQAKAALEFSEFLLGIEDSEDPCDSINFLYNHPSGPLETFDIFYEMYGPESVFYYNSDGSRRDPQLDESLEDELKEALAFFKNVLTIYGL